MLRKIFSRLKPKMSTGIDRLNRKIFKVCESELNKPLIHLIKVSIWSEVFPDKCKVTKVRPAFKKGEEWEVGNYRLILLLPTVSKFIKKAICDQLVCYLVALTF